MTLCFVVLATSAALAQQKKTVPPPPKPADEGPSPEVTTKFIQDKMNSIGPVNYVVYTHDNATDNDRTDRWKSVASRVVGLGRMRHRLLLENGI
jgi:hypothetical protein